MQRVAGPHSDLPGLASQVPFLYVTDREIPYVGPPRVLIYSVQCRSNPSAAQSAARWRECHSGALISTRRPGPLLQRWRSFLSFCSLASPLPSLPTSTLLASRGPSSTNFPSSSPQHIMGDAIGVPQAYVRLILRSFVSQSLVTACFPLVCRVLRLNHCHLPFQTPSDSPETLALSSTTCTGKVLTNTTMALS